MSIGITGAPGEPRKGAAHVSGSELYFALVWMLAKIVTVATALKICSQVSASPSVTFDRTVKFVRHGSLQTICVLLACKQSQRVGDAIPVKHWSGSCQFCRTCSAARGKMYCYETLTHPSHSPHNALHSPSIHARKTPSTTGRPVFTK